MQEWRLLNLPGAADHSNNFIWSTLCSHFGKRGKMGALGGFQQLPGAPGRIRPGWPCRHPGVTQRALIQQLLMAQCHSSWELAWEAGAAGWRLLENSAWQMASPCASAWDFQRKFSSSFS